MVEKEPAPIKYPPGKILAGLFSKVLIIARKFPGVEESRSYGTPAIKVKGKLLARLRSEAEGGLAIRCDFMYREILLTAAPEVFYITDHYANSPFILVNLETVNWKAMPEIVEQAWRMVAADKLSRDYDSHIT